MKAGRHLAANGFWDKGHSRKGFSRGEWGGRQRWPCDGLRTGFEEDDLRPTDGFVSFWVRQKAFDVGESATAANEAPRQLKRNTGDRAKQINGHSDHVQFTGRRCFFGREGEERIDGSSVLEAFSPRAAGPLRWDEEVAFPFVDEIAHEGAEVYPTKCQTLRLRSLLSMGIDGCQIMGDRAVLPPPEGCPSRESRFCRGPESMIADCTESRGTNSRSSGC